MCSQSTHLSLVEQKRLQWAQEKAEMSYFYGIWGQDNSEVKRSNILPPIKDSKLGEESETSGYLSDSPNHSNQDGLWQRSSPDSLISTPDDRLKWGDRGVGVGHLWEPVIDRPESRLPQEMQRCTPRWVERHAKDGQSADILFIQHEEDLSAKNFLLGQNVPVPPEILEERERRRRKALEHQNAIRKQLEEREKKRREEKELRLKQERLEEERIRKEREEERKRLEVERRKQLEKEAMEREKELIMEQALKAASEKVKKKSKQQVKSSDCEVTSGKDNKEQEHFSNSVEKKVLKDSFSQYEANEVDRLDCSVQVEPYFIQYDLSLNLPHVAVGPKRVLTPSKYRIGRFLVDAITQTDEGKCCNAFTHSRRRCSRKTCSGCSSHSERSNSSERTCSTRTRAHCSSIRRCRSQPRVPLNERPKWGINRPTVQYKKQSEKDPHYMRRIRRRTRKSEDGSMKEKLLRSDRQFLSFQTDEESRESVLQNGFRMISNPTSPRFVRIESPNIVSSHSDSGEQAAVESDSVEKSEASVDLKLNHKRPVELKESDEIESFHLSIENLNYNPINKGDDCFAKSTEFEDADEKGTVTGITTFLSTNQVLHQIENLKLDLEKLRKKSGSSVTSSVSSSPSSH